MSFLSISFILLLLAAIVLRLTLGRQKTGKLYLYALIVVSFIFYSWHIPSHLFILLYVCLVAYAHGVWISRAKTKIGVFSGVSLLLIPLLVYKYLDFSIYEIVNPIMGISLQGGGILLPIGISFFTFQAISYVVDVYRGDLTHRTRFSDLVLYLSFFPQLVAGPIVKAKDFLPQISKKRSFKGETVWYGLYLIIQGYFIKFVCADNLSPLVDEGWVDLAKAQSFQVDSVICVLGFSFQIFYDFAGYTMIAKGVAYLLGFRLPDNFNCPYIASSFSSFWRRWHISLSIWFREYLYIPLGGNRLGPVRTSVNLLIVMVLCGIWHGAAWTYIIWGALHGMYLILERGLSKFIFHNKNTKILWFCVVQTCVLIAWVFFRADGASQAFDILRSFVNMNGISIIPSNEASTMFLFMVPGLVLHANGFLNDTWGKALHFYDQYAIHRRSIIAGVFLYFIISSYGISSNFIYFKF